MTNDETTNNEPSIPTFSELEDHYFAHGIREMNIFLTSWLMCELYRINCDLEGIDVTDNSHSKFHDTFCSLAYTWASILYNGDDAMIEGCIKDEIDATGCSRGGAFSVGLFG